MGKVRLAFCSTDEMYAERMTDFLMRYYTDRLELFRFTEENPEIMKEKSNYEVIMLSDCPQLLQELLYTVPEKAKHIIYLSEGSEELRFPDEYRTCYQEATGKGVLFLEKYQDVNKIVDEILKKIGDEVKEFQTTGMIAEKTQILAVYALSENECQLPLAVTLASLLGENRKTLLIDLQENSGISQLTGNEDTEGLEDLLVMAGGGTYSESRMNHCIGHLGKCDFVYPMRNSVNLCETDYSVYRKMLELVSRKTDYDMLVLNLGSRFQGFFDVLEMCRRVYLMQKKNGLAQWREKEFRKELEMLGYGSVQERLVKMELPFIPGSAASCESLVEQWKWNEMGDLIRAHTPEVKMVG